MDQDSAFLPKELFELSDLIGSESAELYFGPTPPSDGEGSSWIQTLPERGWFAYIRIYGQERPAFDGSWKPGDIQELG